MANKRFDIVTIGDCKADQFLQLDRFKVLNDALGDKFLGLPYAQKLNVSKFAAFAGGNALNTAVNFSRLGLRAAVATVLGADHEAEHVLEVLRKEQVSTNLVVRQKRTFTDKSVILVAGGERTILGYHDEKNYERLPKFSTVWVYLTSLGREFKPVYNRVLSERKRQAFKLAFNPGTRQLLYALPAVRAVLKFADLLFLNLQEAQQVCGFKTSAPKVLLNKLHGLGAAIPVITDGAAGAYVFESGKYWHIPAFPAKRVDATGAGDAFASAFTAALILGFEVKEALRWGSVSAAGEIKQVGVHTGLPHKAQILALLKQKSHFQARSII